MKVVRVAIAKSVPASVQGYLPMNYQVLGINQDGHAVISGSDDHGWTLDDYVIPRLGSGLIACREVKLDERPPETGKWYSIVIVHVVKAEDFQKEIVRYTSTTPWDSSNNHTLTILSEILGVEPGDEINVIQNDKHVDGLDC